MLEGKLLDADERKRLEDAVHRTGWSWVSFGERFDLTISQALAVRKGKRQWPVRLTEYVEAVADAVESVPVPAPQGQEEIAVGVTPRVIVDTLGEPIGGPYVPITQGYSPPGGYVATGENAKRLLAEMDRSDPTRLLSVADVAGALADIFMSADARGDEAVQAAVDAAVERLGIEPEVVEAIRERQQAAVDAAETEAMLADQGADPAQGYRSPPQSRQPGALTGVSPFPHDGPSG
jgi:hypothetical protein